MQAVTNGIRLFDDGILWVFSEDVVACVELDGERAQTWLVILASLSADMVSIPGSFLTLLGRGITMGVLGLLPHATTANYQTSLLETLRQIMRSSLRESPESAAFVVHIAQCLMTFAVDQGRANIDRLVIELLNDAIVRSDAFRAVAGHAFFGMVSLLCQVDAPQACFVFRLSRVVIARTEGDVNVSEHMDFDNLKRFVGIRRPPESCCAEMLRFSRQYLAMIGSLAIDEYPRMHHGQHRQVAVCHARACTRAVRRRHGNVRKQVGGEVL